MFAVYKKILQGWWGEFRRKFNQWSFKLGPKQEIVDKQ